MDIQSGPFVLRQSFPIAMHRRNQRRCLIQARAGFQYQRKGRLLIFVSD
jgi:hypothetical protein